MRLHADRRCVETGVERVQRPNGNRGSAASAGEKKREKKGYQNAKRTCSSRAVTNGAASKE